MYVVKIEGKGMTFSDVYFEKFEDAVKCFRDNEKLGFMCSLYNDFEGENEK